MIGDPRVALGFLTRIPVRGPAGLSGDALARAAFWFPAVGLVVGGAAAGVRALAGLVLPAPAATVLALLAAVLVTGGFHEDALADTADGFGAHVPRERKLEIMRDSRIGTYGGLALVFAVLWSSVLLAPLEAGPFARAVLVAHVLGRWSTLPQALALPPARSEGVASVVRTGAATVAAASAYVVVLVLALLGPGDGAIALGVALAVTALGALGVMRTVGGVTGDTYGAVNKLVELSAYAAVVAAR